MEFVCFILSSNTDMLENVAIRRNSCDVCLKNFVSFCHEMSH